MLKNIIINIESLAEGKSLDYSVEIENIKGKIKKLNKNCIDQNVQLILYSNLEKIYIDGFRKHTVEDKIVNDEEFSKIPCYSLAENESANVACTRILKELNIKADETCVIFDRKPNILNKKPCDPKADKETIRFVHSNQITVLSVDDLKSKLFENFEKLKAKQFPEDKNQNNDIAENEFNQNSMQPDAIIQACKDKYSKEGFFARSNFLKLVEKGKMPDRKSIHQYVVKNQKSRTAEIYFNNYVDQLAEGPFKDFLKSYKNEYQFNSIFHKSKLVEKVLRGKINSFEDIETHATENQSGRTAKLLKR